MPTGPWGAAIRRIRLAKGKAWTHRKVARLARMTPTTFGKIEKGGRTLTSQLFDIADALEVPIEDVLLIRDEAPRVGELEAYIDRRVREALADERRRRPPMSDDEIADELRREDAKAVDPSINKQKQPPQMLDTLGTRKKRRSK